MATIVMNMDGCDIAHEALKLKEYGEEAMCSGQDPQRSPAGASPPEEVLDSVRSLLSTAFPKCP